MIDLGLMNWVSSLVSCISGTLITPLMSKLLKDDKSSSIEANVINAANISAKSGKIEEASKYLDSYAGYQERTTKAAIDWAGRDRSASNSVWVKDFIAMVRPICMVISILIVFFVVWRHTELPIGILNLVSFVIGDFLGNTSMNIFQK